MAQIGETQTHAPYSTYVPEREMMVETRSDQQHTTTTITKGQSRAIPNDAGLYLTVQRTVVPGPDVAEAAQSQHEEIVQAVRDGREDDYRIQR